MINRVDFSANAPVHDIRHGALLPDHVAGALTTRLKPGARILDVGAGTGRVSVAFARIGFDVVAIEPAPGMLQALREKAGALSIPCVAAEGSRLPFQNRIADAVVISRLLYLVPGWQGLLRAVSDVLTNHGPILHEWGNGMDDEPWVLIREKARALFEEAGVRNPFHPGRSHRTRSRPVPRGTGLRRRERVAAGPGATISFSDFISKIEGGEISYI